MAVPSWPAIRHPTLAYFTGPTPFFACLADPRVSYCLYVPARTDGDPERYPLLVLQHGTARTAAKYRDAYRDFCEEQRIAVLAPLFPAGLIDPTDLHGFKFLNYRGIRFDLLLLQIIDEAAERLPIVNERFALHGFSGGGQFAHRFLYAHAERLAAVSIGAPGRITLLDETLPWWLGTDGIEKIVGTRPDIEAIRRVAIQLVVGADDTETWEINNPGDSNWMDGVGKTGSTRIERITTLSESLASHGIKAQLDVVPGVAHSGLGVRPAVEAFIADTLSVLRISA